MKMHWQRMLCMLLAMIAMTFPAFAEVVITIRDSSGSTESVQVAEEETAQEEAAQPAQAAKGAASARAAFIDGIVDLAQELYEKANGRAQRAHYSGDIYVCKNFTVHLFKENAEKFRMAEYPDVELVIPDNLPKDQCVEYVYGMEWKDVPASEGNPFYAAAEFRYDPEKTMEENQEIAREFLKQVQRGDYFQMAAKYYYGTGAHSMIFIEDYDAASGTVTWCDSNMKGEKRNGERYGYVQFNAVKDIDWFVDAFCRKKYGATLYRLRDDIIFAD